MKFTKAVQHRRFINKRFLLRELPTESQKVFAIQTHLIGRNGSSTWVPLNKIGHPLIHMDRKRLGLLESCRFPPTALSAYILKKYPSIYSHKDKEGTGKTSITNFTDLINKLIGMKGTLFVSINNFCAGNLPERWIFRLMKAIIRLPMRPGSKKPACNVELFLVLNLSIK